MTPLKLLKATKTLWGLTAPWFAWVAAAVLLVLPFLALIRLWWRVPTILFPNNNLAICEGGKRRQ
jgi:hypothetical protein